MRSLLKSGLAKISKRSIITAIIAGFLILAVIICCIVQGDSPYFNAATYIFGFGTHYRAEDDYIRFLDVGEGDSTLICSNGKTALIDTGPPESAGSLCRKLKKFAVKQIDALIVTHAHMDHMGSCREILNEFPTGCIIVPEIIGDPEGAEELVAAQKSVSENDGRVFRAAEGLKVEVGDFSITIIGYYPDMEDENDRSLFIMAEIRGMKFLLTGDAETKAEKRLLQTKKDISCDVLKVAHHGSNTSSSEEFLDAGSPKIAVISAGYGNTYLHPHESTVSMLEKKRVTIYRTDIYGDIIFKIIKDKYEISYIK